MKTTDWEHLVPHGISGERESAPRTIRFTKEIAAAVEKLAEDRGIDFTTAALGLMKVALGEVPASKKPRLKRAS